MLIDMTAGPLPMMTSAPRPLPRLPGPLARTVRAGARLVPGPVRRLGMESVLSRVLGAHAKSGDMDFLDGRVLCVEVTDFGWRWPLTLAGGSLSCLPGSASPDVTIRGRSDAFLNLVLRRVDPDTVFFQRTLVIEGDTELGLAAKNFLDSVEWDEWRAEIGLPHWLGPKGATRP